MRFSVCMSVCLFVRPSTCSSSCPSPAPHFLFISCSFPVYFLFVSCLFPVCFLFISWLSPVHFLFISCSFFPVRFLFISCSFPVCFLFISCFSSPICASFSIHSFSLQVSLQFSVCSPGQQRTTHEMIFSKTLSVRKVRTATK